ncbi:MAG: carbohydrate binding domain-containing protein, partial [Saccharospirillaceae bacterium]|nr:carbohydrate binding domain-containing protein [Pseudomonadales bacterium]NRB80386.1 carbohydrate binding domain-containing protein [Saccharospirillaceae bacterium]
MSIFKKILLTGSLVSLSLHSLALTNLIKNPNFDSGDNSWVIGFNWSDDGSGSGSAKVDEQGRMCLSVSSISSDEWGVQLKQEGINLVKNTPYIIEFDVWSSKKLRFPAQVMDTVNYSTVLGDRIKVKARLNQSAQHVVIKSRSNKATTNADFRMVLGAGILPVDESICFDNFVLSAPDDSIVLEKLVQGANMIQNGDFDGGALPWETPAWWDNDGAGTALVDAAGRFCTTTDKAGQFDWS